MSTRRTNSVRSLIALGLLVFAFQNCAQVDMKDTTSPSSKSTAGNGGPYGGMVNKAYRYYSSVAPCSTKDLKGQALANTEILFKSGSDGFVAPHLARESCQDIPVPTVIADADIQLNDPTLKTVTYKSTSFSALNPPQDFDIVVASCPVGKTAIPNATRTNMISSSLDWTVQGALAWYLFPGIGTSLFSTIQTLPAYMIGRNDSNYLDFFRRANQDIQLANATEYTYSFVAKPGSVGVADWFIFRGLTGTPGPTDESGLIRFDLQNGTVTTQYAQNVTIRGLMTPFGGGYLCTVYITSSGTSSQSKTSFGVAPSALGQSFGVFGDSIVASAAQLVRTAEFCQ